MNYQSRKGGGKEMKKFIALSIMGLLIVAFSATAYAQPKMTFMATGYLEVTTFLQRNVTIGYGGNFATYWPPNGYYPPPYATSLSGAWDRNVGYWQERCRLWFNFIMDKSLSATVGFELDSGRMGEGSAYTWMGTWNTDQTLVEIMHAFVTAALPYIGIPIPMTVRAGIQPLATRPSIFLYTDGPAITGTLNIDPVLIGLTWAKPFEGKDATADDVDVYAITASAKIGTISVGGFAYYYNMNTYSFDLYSTTYGVSNPYTADMWWFGLNSDGKLGPVDYNFDFVWDYGNVKAKGNTAIPVGAKNKVDYSGFAVQAKVTYPWEKFAFGALGMYASGADLNKTDRLGFPGQATAGSSPGYSSKVGAYVIPPGSEEWAIWGESLVFNVNYITSTALPSTTSPLGQYPNNMTRGAIGGTWVAKLFASVSPVPWYKVTLQGMYIGDTTKHGNTLGDAIRRDYANYRDDSTIGWEVDLLNDIQIYKNLKWSVGAGLLFAGDALDQNITGPTNKSPKNPWMIATKLRYDF
jgi:hypothetical protein